MIGIFVIDVFMVYTYIESMSDKTYNRIQSAAPYVFGLCAMGFVISLIIG